MSTTRSHISLCPPSPRFAQMSIRVPMLKWCFLWGSHLTDPTRPRRRTIAAAKCGPPGYGFGRKVAGGPFHKRDVSFCTEVSVPYANGEVPLVGDYVKNQWEQPGTALEVCLAGDSFLHDQISVRWGRWRGRTCH